MPEARSATHEKVTYVAKNVLLRQNSGDIIRPRQQYAKMANNEGLAALAKLAILNEESRRQTMRQAR
jgi:hypothetical protein